MSPAIAELHDAMQTQHPLVSLREAVISLMNGRRGRFSEEEVMGLLRDLRAEYRKAGDEHGEDMVLDAMDFVVGWCSPHMRVSQTS